MSNPDLTEIKKDIDLELATIRATCEDDDNGPEVLEAQLKKAEALRLIIGNAYEEASQLCCDIEDWIEPEG